MEVSSIVPAAGLTMRQEVLKTVTQKGFQPPT